MTEGISVTSKATIGTRALWHSKDLLRLGMPYQARHLHRRSSRAFQVRVKGIGKFVLRPRSTDPAVVSQVFSWLQYDTSQFPQHLRLRRSYEETLSRGRVPLIIDLGANNGASARWFHREYPAAHIVAIEPDRDNARICRINTDGLNVEVIEAAIGSSPGLVKLDSSISASVSHVTTRTSDGDVQVVTVGDILSEHSGHDLFIVKIDIEGFEEDLFAANTEWVEKAEAIIIEPHDYKFPHRDTSRNFQEVMAKLPYHLLLLGENLVYIRHE